MGVIKRNNRSPSFLSRIWVCTQCCAEGRVQSSSVVNGVNKLLILNQIGWKRTQLREKFWMQFLFAKTIKFKMMQLDVCVFSFPIIILESAQRNCQATQHLKWVQICFSCGPQNKQKTVLIVKGREGRVYQQQHQDLAHIQGCNPSSRGLKGRVDVYRRATHITACVWKFVCVCAFGTMDQITCNFFFFFFLSDLYTSVALFDVSRAFFLFVCFWWFTFWVRRWYGLIKVLFSQFLF